MRGVISPETIGTARLGECCWSLPLRCCRVIRLQQAFPSNQGSEPRKPHPGLSKLLLQPSFPSPRGRASRDKRGQPSLEVVPGVSGCPTSHLGEDGGAAHATTLSGDSSRVTLRTQPALCLDERTQPEPQQSTCFVQSGANNVRRVKPTISLPSTVLQWIREPGAFSLFSPSLILRKAPRAKKKKVYKIFLPTLLLNTKAQ